MFNAMMDVVFFSSIIALISGGLGLVMSQMGVFNMAHGEFFMLGAYGTVVGQRIWENYWIGLFLGVSLSMILGFVVHVVLIKQLLNNLIYTLLGTWGLALIFQQSASIFFGPAPTNIKSVFSGKFVVLGSELPSQRLFVISSSFLVLGLISIYLTKSRFGVVARAVAENRKMCGHLGIRTYKYDALMFSFATGLAGLAGAITGPLISVRPTMGLPYIVVSFCVVITTGIAALRNSLFYIMVNSFLFGGLYIVFSLFTSLSLAQVLTFGVALALLMLRPNGLLTRNDLIIRQH